MGLTPKLNGNVMDAIGKAVKGLKPRPAIHRVVATRILCFPREHGMNLERASCLVKTQVWPQTGGEDDAQTQKNDRTNKRKKPSSLSGPRGT